MSGTRRPRVLTAALVSFTSAVGLLTLLTGFSEQPFIKVIQVLSVLVLGVVVLSAAIVLPLLHVARWQAPMSEDEFELIVQRAERLAANGSWGETDTDEFEHAHGAGEFEPAAVASADPSAEQLSNHERFNALVRSAIDDLPLAFHRVLEYVAVVVSDGGAEVPTEGGGRGAYGLYQGDTVAQSYFHDRIVIFRDTLVRDFGSDPVRLREEVTRTLRHELAHHLGANERDVSDLGL